MRQGFMTFAQTCPQCHGSGQTIKKKCTKCGGAGFEEVETTTTVDIPEGVDDGNRLRIPMQEMLHLTDGVATYISLFM